MIWQSASDYLIRLPRTAKRLLSLAMDVWLCFASIQLAFYLRLGEWQAFDGRPLYSTIVTIVLAIPLFITNGLYRTIFRYSAVDALATIAKAVILFGIPFFIVFTLVGMPGTPRTIGIIGPITLFILVAGSRAAVHWAFGMSYRSRYSDKSRPRAVIYGTGDTGRELALAINQNRSMRVIGFADDDVAFRGSTIAGIPVLSPEQLDALIQQKRVDEVLLALPGISRAKRMEVVRRFASGDVNVRNLPSIIDVVSGKVSVSDLKKVEIEDLLSRKPAPPNDALLDECLRDKVVLVTGAGGSIGSELCRQIMARSPRRLVLVDVAEFNLYAIEHELAELNAAPKKVDLVAALGSVRDQRRMEEVFSLYRPTTVFHAAAYKHVPMIEDNPLEGIENNVLGTRIVVDAATRYDCMFFVLVSSDKAVRPTNVMGATKRFAELIVQAYAAREPDRRFSMVRFGNVLGSSGSVVPLFRKQIAMGGPVTVTDSEVTRYFMTIPEASQLVIQAGAMAHGGEVFVLDMGQPVRIIDLARNMISLSGLTVHEPGITEGDIEIKIVGMRAGEKLYEELLIGDNPEPTDHPAILKAREAKLDWPILSDLLVRLLEGVEQRDTELLLALLRKAVPEFEPRAIT